MKMVFNILTSYYRDFMILIIRDLSGFIVDIFINCLPIIKFINLCMLVYLNFYR